MTSKLTTTIMHPLRLPHRHPTTTPTINIIINTTILKKRTIPIIPIDLHHPNPKRIRKAQFKNRYCDKVIEPECCGADVDACWVVD
jgi:hypothetical protein